MRVVCFSPAQLSSNGLLSILGFPAVIINSQTAQLNEMDVLYDLDVLRILDVNSFFSLAHAILSLEMEPAIEFMQQALAEAHSAAAVGEVPIGAVLVHDGKVLARSSNRTIRDNDPTAHAEILVLREAARLLGNHRLAGTTLYVTIEPCSMCAGAIVQARVPRLVYGADDPKGGAVHSCFEILSNARLNHQVEITAGILAPEAAAILQSFFAARR
jgi:tRNA(adenine34) deaminase